MWSFVLSIVSWVLSLLGFGKPDPYKQGVSAGKDATTKSDALGELHDIKTASDARDSVTDDSSSILRDGDNAGPAK